VLGVDEQCAPRDDLCPEGLLCLPDLIEDACSEDCRFSDDGECDDGREGAVSGACARGTDCADCGPVDVRNPDAGRCRPLCSTEVPSARNGCGARDFCFSLQDERNPSLGLCIAGDACTVDGAGCGDDEACLALAPATFCIEGGAAPLGGACGGAEAACEPGLSCVYGACKAPCGDGCPEGEACIDYSERLDGVEFRFCHGACGAIGQEGCGEQEACAVVDLDDAGVAVGQCVDGGGAGVHGDACQPDEAAYWGSCDAGHLCAAAGEANECFAFCDAEHQGCGGGSACVRRIFGGRFADLGLCLGECTVVGADSGCAAGQVCAFTGRIGTDEEGAETAVGLCAPSNGAGATGDACAVDAAGASDCANGHICAAIREGEAPSCLRICEVGGAACPDDRECIVDLFGADALGEGGSQAIGLCLEEDPR